MRGTHAVKGPPQAKPVEGTVAPSAGSLKSQRFWISLQQLSRLRAVSEAGQRISGAKRADPDRRIPDLSPELRWRAHRWSPPELVWQAHSCLHPHKYRRAL